MLDYAPVAVSSIHREHLSLGANMVMNQGWLRPYNYIDVEVEVESVTEKAGICDISPVGKTMFQGTDIDMRMSELFVGYESMKTGRTKRLMDKESLEVTIARLETEGALVISNPNQSPKLLSQLENGDDCVHVTDVTSALSAISITGPYSTRILAGLTDMGVDGFGDMCCTEGVVAGVHGTLMRRDFGQMTNYELYFGSDYGQYIWEALLQIGDRYGALPFGTGSFDRIVELTNSV